MIPAIPWRVKRSIITAGIVGIALGAMSVWWLKPSPPCSAPLVSSGVVRSPGPEGVAIGWCVLDENGETIAASPLAETAMCPASALKSLTAGAALETLGPDFRYETTLAISEFPEQATSLRLIGSGDPTLETADLDALADAAVKAGLKNVIGSMRADGSAFPFHPINDHWVWGDLGNAYGTGAYAINVSHNAARIIFSAGKSEGEKASLLRTEPDITPLVSFTNSVTTGPLGSGDGVTIYSSPLSPAIRATGTVPLGAREFSVNAAIPNPPAFAIHYLRAAMEKRGVTIEDALPATSKLFPIATHRSAPLVEIIRHMQAASDNLEAQCLFLTMGVREKQNPAAFLEAHWRKRGVDFKALRIVDGSGLARATMIRPIDLARVHFLAAKGKSGAAFVDTLPASADGKTRSKRGAMSGVRTEAGFFYQGNRRFTFALMMNGLSNADDFWKTRAMLMEDWKRLSSP